MKFVTCSRHVTNFTNTLCFREQVPIGINGSKLGFNFMSKVQSSASASRVTCSNDACLPAHSYMVQMYFIVRLHHYLREQNRQMQSASCIEKQEDSEIDASVRILHVYALALFTGFTTFLIKVNNYI